MDHGLYGAHFPPEARTVAARARRSHSWPAGKPPSGGWATSTARSRPAAGLRPRCSRTLLSPAAAHARSPECALTHRRRRLRGGATDCRAGRHARFSLLKRQRHVGTPRRLDVVLSSHVICPSVDARFARNSAVKPRPPVATALSARGPVARRAPQSFTRSYARALRYLRHGLYLVYILSMIILWSRR
jgi:hypothetical protein